MKTNKYIVKIDGIEITSTYAWFSAIKATERLIKNIANSENVTYKLIESCTEKQGKKCVSGYRLWSSEISTVKFAIEKAP